MKLSVAMEDALIKMAGMQQDAHSVSVVSMPMASRTATALESRGLMEKVYIDVAPGYRWALTDAGWNAADKLMLTVPVPVVSGDDLSMSDDVEDLDRVRGAAEATFIPGRVIVDGAGFPHLLTGGELAAFEVSESRGTVGKLCRIKKSSAGHRAKWRKGR